MNLFHVDALSTIMILLISFVFLIIMTFSKNYLNGDKKQTHFYGNLTALIFSTLILVTSNHLLLFFISWCCSNFFLVLLMGHKFEWQQAKQSARLASKNFLIGASAIGISFIFLYQTTGTAFIQKIITFQTHSFALVLLIVGAMTQSALLPFHNWLLSSLNSPTPVSAIMHAGLINGGGFLIIRFAPLFLQNTTLLTILFIFGIITSIVGGLFQIIQTDIKRLLTCSTISQMGFMIAQCGLGLFPAAAAHIFWHGLFKAYLLIASGGAAQRKRIQYCAPTIIEFLLSTACSLSGMLIFIKINHINFLAMNTNLILIALVFIVGIQATIPLIKKNKFSALLGACFIGTIYGYSVYFIELFLKPMNLNQPQQINIIYILGMIILICGWLFVLFEKYKKNTPWMLRSYVFMVNAGQPDKTTITASRNQYKS